MDSLTLIVLASVSCARMSMTPITDGTSLDVERLEEHTATVSQADA